MKNKPTIPDYLSADQVRALLRTTALTALRPRPWMSLSEWAGEYGRLNVETSAAPGRFKPWPFQPGIMDSISDLDTRQTTVMKSTRVGYSQIVNFALGYFMHWRPRPCGFYLPTDEDAKSHSRKHIDPFIKSTPCLSEILVDNAANKRSNDTLTVKRFSTGGSIDLRGANKAVRYKKETFGHVFLDELTDYPDDVQGQGSPVKLAAQRHQTFWDGQLVVGSTPGVEGACKISVEFATSDQRRYFVPCPHCDEMQHLEWGGRKEEGRKHGLKWDKETKRAFYVCVNGCEIDERHKVEMLERGEWRATAVATKRGHVGFHINALYSLLPNTRWQDLVEAWLLAVDASKRGDFGELKSFVNNYLGEPWKHQKAQAIPVEVSEARNRKAFDAPVPDDVQFITMGVDVQGDRGDGDGRLEYEVVGWDSSRRSWQIEFGKIPGKPTDPAVKQQLADKVFETWTKADGTALAVQATCIDTGGHFQSEICQFAAALAHRRVFAVKGRSERPGSTAPIWPGNPGQSKDGFKIWQVGTYLAKDLIWEARAALPGEPWHMATDPTRCPPDWWAQVDAEKPLIKVVGGVELRFWKKTKARNEALDCRVYALAGAEALMRMGLLTALTNPKQSGTTVEVQDAPTAPAAAPAPVQRTPAVPSLRGGRIGGGQGRKRF